uniref:Uncharacterized protein n=1 Tax=Anopheles braziliensis TaxID=58242 RepID=A0A2M3ZLP6_9DIPT
MGKAAIHLALYIVCVCLSINHGIQIRVKFHVAKLRKKQSLHSIAIRSSYHAILARETHYFTQNTGHNSQVRVTCLNRSKKKSYQFLNTQRVRGMCIYIICICIYI